MEIEEVEDEPSLTTVKGCGSRDLHGCVGYGCAEDRRDRSREPAKDIKMEDRARVRFGNVFLLKVAN